MCLAKYRRQLHPRLVERTGSPIAARRPRDTRLITALLALRRRVAEFRPPGVVPQLQRLLTVEGYEVVGLDVDGVTVVLDEPLGREQVRV